jgi:hypothetical protein
MKKKKKNLSGFYGVGFNSCQSVQSILYQNRIHSQRNFPIVVVGD